MPNKLINNKKLMKEWNWEKNLIYVPNELSFGSSKKVWWKCEKGHEWEAVIHTRSKGVGCPYCSNRKVLKGFNDIATTNPKLLTEWNYKKNSEIGITPYEVSHGSTKKVWWKCKYGHEYEIPIVQKINGNVNCPICSNQKVLKGFNDFVTKHPTLMKEWNYEKNDKLGIKPDEIVMGGKNKIWWKCDKGHEWQSIIATRIKNDKSYHKCPVCSNYLKSSIPEKIIYYYIKKIYPKTEANFKPEWLKPKELDIFIPEKNIGIEYDGNYYHKDIKRDKEKDELCKKHGLTLIRIREKGCPVIDNNTITYKIKNNNNTDYTYMEDVLKYLQKYFKITIDFDLKRDFEDIIKMITFIEKEKSLSKTNPEVLKEWNYEKNNKLGITPENISNGSSLKVWWICEKNHNYKATIVNKVIRGTNCPYCSGKRVLKGFNDLATVRPDLLKEWNLGENSKIGLTPDNITIGSGKQIYWNCPKGHIYKAIIENKINKGSGCPYCSGHQTLKGFNDIATTNVELLKEWDYEKNTEISITPYDISFGSTKKVWWKCEKNHHYLASPNARTSKKIGCPYCSNERLLEGYNDLATTNPEILKEWNYEKNDKLELYPNHFFAGSTKKVWWICEKNHSYEATIVNKVIQGTNCPYCSSNKILSGFNDISTTMPQALKIWNYEKNDKLKIYPTNISKNSGKKIWWYCNKCDNEWEAIVANMNKVDFECPVCRKQRIHNNNIKQKQKEYEKKLLLKTNMLLVINYNGIKEIAEYKCLNCNKTFNKRADVILYNPKCPYCKNNYTNR